MTGKPPQTEGNTDAMWPLNSTPPTMESSALSQQLLRAIDSISDTVMLIDADGIVVYANQSMLKQCGYDIDHLIGRSITTLWIQPDKHTREIIVEALAKRIWRGRIQHKVKQGGSFWEKVTISPVVDEKNAVTHLIKSGRRLDTTDEWSTISGQIDLSDKRILDLMGDGYIELDLKGTITFLTESAARIYRRSQAEMLNLNYKACMTPTEADKIFQTFNEIYRTGHSGRIIDYEVIGKDGTPVFCEIIISLLRDYQGTPVGFGCIIRDVTEKKQLTDMLKESEESYHRVMELTPDAICITRVSDGQIFEVNEAFCHQTGYARHEVIDRTVNDLNLYINPEDRDRIFAALREKGCVTSIRANFRHRNGALLHGIVSARCIQFKGQACILFIGILINSLVEAQNALRESEESYRVILESAPNAMAVLSKSDFTYFTVNKAFCNLIGYSENEMIGKKDGIDIKFAADPHQREQIIKRIKETGELSHQEVQIHTKDGRLIHSLLSISPIRYKCEDCLLASGFDITPLKTAQAALKESESRLRAFFKTAAEAILVTDLETGRFLDVNPAACQHLGYSADKLTMMYLKDIIHDSFSYQIPADSISGSYPEPVFFESVHVNSTGAQIPVEVSNTIVMRSGQPALLSIVRDVSERKQTEAELEKYRQHLEEMVQERTHALKKAQNELIKQEKLAVLGKLTATVSHELRNPLGVIRTSNYFLSRKITDKDEKIDKHIKRIEEQVRVCDTIVADLLEFTRGRQVSVKKQAIEPWMKNIVRQLMESGHIDIKMDIAENLPKVPHDQEKMRRVVINLLDNAIQAVCDKQNASHRINVPYQPIITLKAGRHSDGLLLQVSDNGSGMDEATCQRAFEPLFTTRARGTGIGLANVMKIVSEHGGDVMLKSQKDQGTTMTVTLPNEPNRRLK